jgi:tyrosinase
MLRNDEQMIQVVTSPGDPIFFLHHAYLDHAWWQWQQANLSSRLTDISGPNVPSSETLELEGVDYPSAAILDYNGDPGNVTTLNHTLWMANLIANATVGDVMDLGGQVSCAEYV